MRVRGTAAVLAAQNRLVDDLRPVGVWLGDHGILWLGRVRWSWDQSPNAARSSAAGTGLAESCVADATGGCRNVAGLPVGLCGAVGGLVVRPLASGVVVATGRQCHYPAAACQGSRMMVWDQAAGGLLDQEPLWGVGSSTFVTGRNGGRGGDHFAVS